jgi:hypothetical protein
MEQPATPSLDIRLEAERIVIGNAFHDPEWLATAIKDSQPDLFVEPRHRIVWRAIRETTTPGNPADEVAIMAHLQQEGTLEQVGGYASIAEFPARLTGPAPFAARHLESFKEDAKKAKVVDAMRRLSGMAHVLNAAEMADEARRIAALAEPDRKPGDNGPARFDFAELLNFDREADPTTVLGNRWLCRGGSCLLVAQTGAGKSALTTQAAMTWALGRDFFGIRPKRGSLRSLVIQSENDLGDVAESVQGTLAGMGIGASTQLASEIGQRVAFYREAVRTGEDFGKLLRELVIAHQADLVFIDPLLGFAGIDIADQEAASHFLRHILQPVLTETGVVLFSIHHTTKPKPKAEQAGNTANDLSYLGAGSAELANWHRAVMVLQRDQTAEGQPEQPHFTLRLAKRGGRAGLKDAQGDFTTSIPIRHAREPGVIRWERRNDTTPSNGMAL